MSPAQKSDLPKHKEGLFEDAALCAFCLPGPLFFSSSRKLSPLGETQTLLLIDGKVGDAAQHKDAPRDKGVNLPSSTQRLGSKCVEYCRTGLCPV